MSTHNWLRNVESKENMHSRTSVNSGDPEKQSDMFIRGLLSSICFKEIKDFLLSAGCSEDLFGPVLSFFHSMATLRVTEAEYTLLTATALLCSGQTTSDL